MTMAFYTELAGYYDRIYHYIDYGKQVDMFIDIIGKPGKVLDVACGTGTHADILQKRGFSVTGVDISGEMLDEARKKNPNIRFIEQDMRKLDIGDKFNAIVCFFNSILYNRTPEEMAATLKNFYAHLEAGGVLIFDMVDKSIGVGSRKEEYKYEDENLNIVFRPQWIYKEGVMDLEIDFAVNGRQIHDHHVMGAFSFEDLERLTEEAGFNTEIRKDGKKAVFVCRKP